VLLLLRYYFELDYLAVIYQICTLIRPKSGRIVLEVQLRHKIANSCVIEGPVSLLSLLLDLRFPLLIFLLTDASTGCFLMPIIFGKL